ncbi:glycosyltransferase [Bradyrhizobium sp. AUGA SZCCT0283]|uniref:glycosyltransferase n=1 Tax=Bradyrhizobium sp. AUGA SZCCT0283 TaxID=2807671 RepID=UPI001BA8F789|nr:glycosyltransferase [Bradyrhizobium sp. AUGA SZCCT0283]MBR1277487.1 glycosyltransferase [Bradyrhizobium sp. AUGA SZCCT0283]
MSTRSPRIVFLANDTGFFFRHFAPAIEAALEIRATIVALLPEPPDADARECFSGVEVITTPLVQRGDSAWALASKVLWLASTLRSVNPDIVVGYSLRSVIALAIAFPALRAKRLVFVVTGLGLIELLENKKGKFCRSIFYFLMRCLNRSSRAWFIFENHSDATRIGIPPTRRARHIILMGAGVDPAEFQPKPEPLLSPLRLATVSRLVWSKGVDLAVEAVSALVKAGYNVSLDIYGGPDPANPRSVDEATIAKWNSMAGVHYRGHVKDVAPVWHEHHVGLFPSRGGEGLPRALLEAAACGRPTIVARVPGCEDFIRDGIEGFVVRPDSVEDLKLAIKRFLQEADLITRFGKAGRQRYLQTATSAIVKRQYECLFRLEAKQGRASQTLEANVSADCETFSRSELARLP